MTELSWMLLPALACLIMALALGWFGLQVLQRGVIFVDLALAQVAALGTTYAVFLGHEPDEPVSYALALFATAVGAVAFSTARNFEEWVPQEALIGIAYAVTAAGGVLMLEFASDPHGAEKLQHLAVGNVVWVSSSEVVVMAGVVGVVGLLHGLFHKRLLAVTEGQKSPLWDMFFYLSFGLVITSIVHVGGVLLIFSLLVIPAVVARLFARGTWSRLLLGYAVVVPVCLLGVGVSYEHAAGPVIVVLLAVVLFISLNVVALRSSPSPGRVVVKLAVAGLAIAAGLYGFAFAPSEHGHEEVDHAAHVERPASPADRERSYREHAEEPQRLLEALEVEDDPSLRLLLGTALARSGEARGLEVLAEVAQDPAAFLRMEADDRLRAIAGEGAPTFDPLAGPDEGVWSAWASSPPLGWTGAAKGLELPI